MVNIEGLAQSALTAPKADVTSIDIVNNKIVITGSSFVNIKTVQISDANGTHNLSIDSQTSSEIILSATDTFAFLAQGAMNLIFSNAYGQVAIPITVDIGSIDSMGAVPGQILQYTASGWAPSDLSGTVYAGTWDASSGIDPDVQNSITAQDGNYFIVAVAGTHNLDGTASWAVGDWAIFNGATGFWEKIPAALSTVDWINVNKTGSSVGDMADVDLTSIQANDVLSWDGSKFIAVPFTDASGNLSVTGDVCSGSYCLNTIGSASGEANTASNLGTGAQIFSAKTGVDLAFRSIIGGTGVTATQNANDITLSVTEADINIGNLTGTLAVAKGGTGASTAAAARTNLGLGNAAVADVDTTTTLGVSDALVPSQNAVKTYVDTQVAAVPRDIIKDADTNTLIQVEESANEDIIRFDTAGTERMVIDATGNVGVGTTAPIGLLQVSGDTATLAPLRVTNTMSAGTYAEAGRFEAPNLPVNGQHYLTIGKDTGNFNRMSVNFKYVGNNSTSNRIALHFTGAEEILNILASRKVGINTVTPRADLDVNGAIISAAPIADNDGTFDFATGNIQYTTSSCGAMALHNLKSGGSYSFFVQGATSATCSFTAYSDAGTTALTVHMPPNHGATEAGKHTIYSIMVAGTHAYISWAPGY